MIDCLDGLNFTAMHEGFRPYAYPDPASDVATQLALYSPGFRPGYQPFLECGDARLIDMVSSGVIDGSPWTMGYGQTTKNNIPVCMSDSITETDAKVWLSNKSDEFRKKIRSIINPALSPSQARMSAMTDLAYNVGPRGFPMLIQMINKGQYGEASKQFLNCIYAQEKPFMGLILRRIGNYNTFVNGTYLKFNKYDKIPKSIIDLLMLLNSQHPEAIKMIKLLKVDYA